MPGQKLKEKLNLKNRSIAQKAYKRTIKAILTLLQSPQGDHQKSRKEVREKTRP